MNIEVLETYIDRHGSDPTKWPATDEREQVIGFLEQSEQARHLLQENQSLFELLETAMHVRDPVGLEARILDAVRSKQENWWTSTLVQWILRPALVALPLVLGFLIGLSATDSSVFVENELTSVRFDDHSDLLAIADD